MVALAEKQDPSESGILQEPSLGLPSSLVPPLGHQQPDPHKPLEAPWLGVSFALWGPSIPMEASCPVCWVSGPGEHDCDGASDYAGQKVARTSFQNVPGTDLPYFSCPSLLVFLALILQREEGSREHAKHLSSGVMPPEFKL